MKKVIHNMEFNLRKGDFSKLGVVKGRTGANFCIECRKESDCKILIYQRGQSEKLQELSVSKEFSKGNLRAVQIDGLSLAEYDYNFWIDGEIVLDPYAKRIIGREIWADSSRSVNDILRCRYEESNFSWRGDCEVEIPRKDMVLYKLHVRGFTKGLSEGTPDRGTFCGLAKKLSYLKSLGITSIELMPVYEFEELIFQEAEELPEYIKWKSKKKDKIKKPKAKLSHKINYWGYGEGLYFAPKAGYASSEMPDLELKKCILQMHKKGMECILEMDFPDTVPMERIFAVLRYWVREYHVDGFHLQGNRIPIQLLLEDSYLGRTKFFYKNLSQNIVPEKEEQYPRAFLDTDEFLYPCRKLAGGIDGNVWQIADQMKKQNTRLGYINYIADHNGFTLRDLFSYECKHNEANGENNADGMVWNYSINCGVEGETSSRNVYRLRDRRMKNAVAVLLLAQGVPMIMAGDEDYNTQQGNNNVYCQDNPVGWKDWSGSRQSKDFLKYMKRMIAFRKEHAILRMEQPMALADTLSCGCPDLSYHGEDAWITPGFSNWKSVGLLYCGKYAAEKEDIYIGFNFSDFPKKLAVPQQKESRHWYLCMDTALKSAFVSEPEELHEDWYTLEAQSVCIIIGK